MYEDVPNTNPVLTEYLPAGRSGAPSTVNDRSARLSYVFLLLFTVAIYARPEDIFPFLAPLHSTFILGLSSGLTYIGALLSGNARLRWSRELWIVLLLTAWYAAGVPFSLWRSGSLEVFTQVWLKTVLIFFLLTQTLITVQRIHGLLWAIILSELVVTSYSIFQSSRVIWVGERLSGVNLGILGWNFLGIAVAITIPYIAAMFVSRRSILSTGLLAAASLSMLWMLVLTASRGGLLNVLLSAGLTFLLVLRGGLRGRMAGMAIIAALFIAVSMAPQVFWQRLGTVWDSSDGMNAIQESAEESTQDRVAVLDRSIKYTLEHPIFGLGLGNFEVASGLELGRPGAWMGTHNTFTQVSSEAGVPALLLFVALLITALLNMRRVSRAAVTPEVNLMARATLASLLAFAFGAVFAHLAYEYYVFYPVANAVGIYTIAEATPQVNAADTHPPIAAGTQVQEEVLC